MRKPLMLPSLMLTLLLLAAGCAIPPDISNRGTQINLAFAPSPLTIGDAVAVVSVTKDRVGQPNLQVILRGAVNAVGIPPQAGGGITDADGHTVIPFKWTSGGDWNITVTVRLANGTVMTQDFSIYVPA